MKTIYVLGGSVLMAIAASTGLLMILTTPASSETPTTSNAVSREIVTTVHDTPNGLFMRMYDTKYRIVCYQRTGIKAYSTPVSCVKF